MTHYINTEDFANEMDLKDPMRNFRNRFYFPQMNGKDVLYFTGNSLGLQPKTTQDLVLKELEDWATWGVEGHFHARNPWFSYQDILTEQIAEILGAKSDEVVSMNSLTTNLHLLMVSFYRPTKTRYKILCEYDLFPSDLYALQSQVSYHGYDPDDAIIALKARPGEHALRTEDILKTIEDNKDSLCMVMLGAVNYYTGQLFEIEKITAAAHAVGATVGYNLAHAAGNVMLQLHDWNVDFACFCSYKYLNSGPGGVSGIFVHNRFSNDKSLPRFAGWWGNDPETRFKMPRNFEPASGARGWQLSNAPVLSMAALKASLDIITEAGMSQMKTKSRLLTAYLEFLIKDINSKCKLSGKEEPIQIITPGDPDQRGCQLSLIIRRNGRDVYQSLMKAGILVDWREPDVIRLAPVPLYNSFSDVYQLCKFLSEQCSKE